MNNKQKRSPLLFSSNLIFCGQRFTAKTFEMASFTSIKLFEKNGLLIVSLNYIIHMYSQCRHQSANRKLHKKKFYSPFTTLECVSLKTYFHFTDHTGYSSKHLYTALNSILSLLIPSNCSRKYAMQAR